jgi:hypothetical protein
MCKNIFYYLFLKFAVLGMLVLEWQSQSNSQLSYYCSDFFGFNGFSTVLKDIDLDYGN